MAKNEMMLAAVLDPWAATRFNKQIAAFAVCG
jgi:hypothetical protein